MSIEWHSLESLLTHQDNDKRIQGLNSLKQLLLEESPISDSDTLATTLKSSLKSNNSHVSNAALSILPLYFSHLPPNNPHSLKHALVQLLPHILDKLGDTKQSTREAARDSLNNAAKVNLEIGIHSVSYSKDREPIWNLIEEGIKESGFHSKNPKAREQALLFLLSIRTPSTTSPDSPLPPLKPFTPLLLPLLADPDPTVRSTALSTTISIFSHPSITSPAKTALKKEMSKLDLPKKVQDHILQSVLGGGGSSTGMERTTTTSSQSSSENGSITSPAPPAPAPTQGPATRTRTKAATSSSSPSLLSSLPSTAFPSDPSAVHSSSSSTSIEPVYLASLQDMRSQFERMKPCFEGKETEHNWIERDKSVGLIRGMLIGGVCEREDQEWKEEFVKCVKEVQDGIMKTSSSLRTTLAISALTLLTSLATSLPTPLLDTISDPFLPHTLSMSSQTKKIVASASQQTAESFLTHLSYSYKTTQLLSQGMNEKTVQARQYYSLHLFTFLRVHGKKSKKIMDSNGGGTEELKFGIKKGLGDPNAGVRENSRRAYWEFWREWKGEAEEVREGLDSQQKKLLDKIRPSGQDGEKSEIGAKNGGDGDSLRKSVRGRLVPPRTAKKEEEQGQEVETMTKTIKKPSVRELMLAAKRKKMAEEEQEEQAAKAEQVRAGEEAEEEELDAIPTTTPLKLPPVASEYSPPSRPLPPSNRSQRQDLQENELDESSPLQEVSSPFNNPSLLPSQQQETPSRPTPSRSHARQPQAPVNLPILEPFVDESLKEQASQAEQTAERLLEIAQEDEDSEAHSHSHSIGVGTPKPYEKSGLGTMQTPLHQNGKSSLLFNGARKGGNDVFRDSPDVRDGTGGGGKGIWWEKKNQLDSSNVAKPLPVDSQDRTNEIDSLISRLSSLEIDSNDMKKLSQLSRERPVREGEEEEEGTAATWWREGKRFEKAYEGVRKQLLRSDQILNSEDMALIVLRDLVENQFPCFSGDEAGVFELLFHLREDPSRTTIAATESIATTFTSRIEPLYGLGTLCPSLQTYLESTSAPQDAKARSFALALKLVGGFFESLPAEVLEDVFTQSKDLIKKALNDQSSGDLRRAAINALVSAQSVLRDEKKLTEMIDGLEPDQANLLSYYCAKRGV